VMGLTASGGTPEDDRERQTFLADVVKRV
jgi:hypothetical protein